MKRARMQEFIGVRLSTSDRLLVESEARRAGGTLSGYIRWAAVDRALHEVANRVENSTEAEANLTGNRNTVPA